MKISWFMFVRETLAAWAGTRCNSEGKKRNCERRGCTCKRKATATDPNAPGRALYSSDFRGDVTLVMRRGTSFLEGIM